MAVKCFFSSSNFSKELIVGWKYVPCVACAEDRQNHSNNAYETFCCLICLWVILWGLTISFSFLFSKIVITIFCLHLRAVISPLLSNIQVGKEQGCQQNYSLCDKEIILDYISCTASNMVIVFFVCFLLVCISWSHDQYIMESLFESIC